jgi:hypothetical protein
MVVELLMLGAGVWMYARANPLGWQVDRRRTPRVRTGCS